MKCIKQFFVDDTGAFSMGRLVTFLIFISAMVVLFYSMTTVSLDQNRIELVKWMLGFATGGKVLQSFAENINKG